MSPFNVKFDSKITDIAVGYDYSAFLDENY